VPAPVPKVLAFLARRPTKRAAEQNTRSVPRRRAGPGRRAPATGRTPAPQPARAWCYGGGQRGRSLDRRKPRRTTTVVRGVIAAPPAARTRAPPSSVAQSGCSEITPLPSALHKVWVRRRRRAPTGA
jgi:hypothetical protein